MRLRIALPSLVVRVRLAGEDDLHRPVRVADQAQEPRVVGCEEPGALVAREPPREADRERLGDELRRRRCDGAVREPPVHVSR